MPAWDAWRASRHAPRACSTGRSSNATRAQIEQHHGRPLSNGCSAPRCSRVLPYPSVLRVVLAPLAIAQAVGQGSSGRSRQPHQSNRTPGYCGVRLQAEGWRACPSSGDARPGAAHRVAFPDRSPARADRRGGHAAAPRRPAHRVRAADRVSGRQPGDGSRAGGGGLRGHRARRAGMLRRACRVMPAVSTKRARSRAGRSKTSSGPASTSWSSTPRDAARR